MLLEKLPTNFLSGCLKAIFQKIEMLLEKLPTNFLSGCLKAIFQKIENYYYIYRHFYLI